MLQERKGGQEKQTEIEAFLNAIGVKHPVRISSAEKNGHSVLATWTGEKIRVDEIDRESVLAAGGSGCLEIQDGHVHTTIFVRVVDKSKSGEVMKPMNADPRQLRMELKL